MGGSASSSTDEYFNVNLATARLMGDNQLYTAKVREAVKMQDDHRYGLTGMLRGFNLAGAYPLMNYYNFSTWYNKYAFPDVSLYGVNIPKEQIQDLVIDRYDMVEEDVFFTTTVSFGIPTLNTWSVYMLQEKHDYDITLPYLEVVAGTREVEKEREVIIDGKVVIEKYTVIEDIINKFTIISFEEVMEEYTETVYDDYLNTYVVITKTRVKHINVVTEYFIENPDEVPDPIPTPPTIHLPVNPKQLAYMAKVKGEVTKAWVYFPLMGDNPSIGQTNIPSLMLPVGGKETFKTFPITLLRHNYFSLDETHINVKNLPAGDRLFTVYRPSSITHETREDTDYTLNSLGLRLEYLLKTINENPDVQKISDAMVFCGIDPADKHPVTSKLLYDTIELLATKQNIYTNVPPVIPDEDDDEEVVPDFMVTMGREPFNLALQWSSANKYTKDEVIGDVDSHSHESVTRTHAWAYNLETEEKWYIGTYDTPIGEPADKSNNESKSKVTSHTRDDDDDEDLIIYSHQSYEVLIIKKQVTPEQVEVIEIVRLLGVTSIGRSYQGNSNEAATGGRLIIPLPYEVYDAATPIEKIEVMERTLRFVFYAAQLHIQELKWYETSIFKAITIIIAFIIIILVNIYVPVGGQAITAGILGVLKSLAIGIAITIAIKILAAIIDIPFISQILAVVAIAVSIYTGYTDLSNFTHLISTAVQLVTIALSVVEGIINMKTQDILKDMQDLREKYTAKAEEYSTIIKNLSLETITTEDVVELQTSDKIYLVPSSNYYEMQFGLLTNYDLQFNSSYDSVHEFYNDKFNARM